jgi:hypothetical protein
VIADHFIVENGQDGRTYIPICKRAYPAKERCDPQKLLSYSIPRKIKLINSKNLSNFLNIKMNWNKSTLCSPSCRPISNLKENNFLIPFFPSHLEYI